MKMVVPFLRLAAREDEIAGGSSASEASQARNAPRHHR
jgi:hypothetical protein